MSAAILLPRGATRHDLVEDPFHWATMAFIFILLAGTGLALEINDDNPSLITEVLMGVGLVIGFVIAVVKPPKAGSRANQLVLLVICGAVLVGLCTPNGEVFLGGAIFIGPQLGMRLDERRHVAWASGAFVAGVAAIAAAGLTGVIDGMEPLTALAIMLLVPMTPILASTVVTTLEVSERQGVALERLTRVDALTAVANRRGMMETLAATLHDAAQTRDDASIVVLNLDDFKGLNDRFGHPAGDRALIDCAAALQAAFPAPAVVTRLGGDEFCVILPEPAPQPPDVVAIVQRSLAGVRTPGGAVTAGAGAARFPADGEDADTLLRSADERLRQAKSARH